MKKRYDCQVKEARFSEGQFVWFYSPQAEKDEEEMAQSKLGTVEDCAKDQPGKFRNSTVP